MHKTKALTLIELVIVLLILGILATVLVSKFTEIRKTNIESQEEAIIGALREAAYNYVLVHKGEAYDGNPFDLLTVAPPNKKAGTVQCLGDGTHWSYFPLGLTSAKTRAQGYVVRCPHRKDTPPIGNLWYYVVTGSTLAGSGPGSIEERYQNGH